MAINYLAQLKEQFIEHFTLVKNNTPDKALILRLQGYIYAGEVVGLVTKEDAQAIMEEKHKQVFGQWIEARKNVKNKPSKLYKPVMITILIFQLLSEKWLRDCFKLLSSSFLIQLM